MKILCRPGCHLCACPQHLSIVSTASRTRGSRIEVLAFLCLFGCAVPLACAVFWAVSLALQALFGSVRFPGEFRNPVVPRRMENRLRF